LGCENISEKPTVTERWELRQEDAVSEATTLRGAWTGIAASASRILENGGGGALSASLAQPDRSQDY
jgi:hypothetical protein